MLNERVEVLGRLAKEIYIKWGETKEDSIPDKYTYTKREKEIQKEAQTNQKQTNV